MILMLLIMLEANLFIVTNLNAPNKKIVTVDASNPSPENWEDFIPETEYRFKPIQQEVAISLQSIWLMPFLK